MFEMDPFCVPLRFNEETFAASAPKVKVGWFVNDGFFDACKATARTLVCKLHAGRSHRRGGLGGVQEEDRGVQG